MAMAIILPMYIRPTIPIRLTMPTRLTTLIHLTISIRLTTSRLTTPLHPPIPIITRPDQGHIGLIHLTQWVVVLLPFDFAYRHAIMIQELTLSFGPTTVHKLVFF